MSAEDDALPLGAFAGASATLVSLRASEPELQERALPEHFARALLADPEPDERVVIAATAAGRVLAVAGFRPGRGLDTGLLELHGARLTPREPGDPAMRALNELTRWYGSLAGVEGTFAEVPDERLEAGCILYGMGFRGEWRLGPLGAGRTRLAVPTFQRRPAPQRAETPPLSWPASLPTSRDAPVARRDSIMHPSDAAPLLRAPLARRWLGLPESAGPEAITRFVETSEDIRFQACGPAGCRSWLLIERAQCEQPEAWLHTEEARAARRAPHLRALREALLESQPEWVLHDRAPATAALLAGLTPWGPAPLVGADGPQLWRPTR